MKKMLSAALVTAGIVAATIGTMGTWFLVFDEPNCPKSLLK